MVTGSVAVACNGFRVRYARGVTSLPLLHSSPLSCCLFPLFASRRILQKTRLATWCCKWHTHMLTQHTRWPAFSS
jgi:hypothetical protein